MNNKLKKVEVSEILKREIIGDLENMFKEQTSKMDEESKGVFLKMMKMESLYHINFLSKEIVNGNNDYVIFLSKSSVEENIENLKREIKKQALLLTFFKDNSEDDFNINSFHYIKDMLFLNEEQVENISNAFRTNKYMDNQELQDLMTLSINENKSFQKFVNKNSDLLASLNCSNKIRNPFVRTLNKLKGLEKIITVYDLVGLNDKEYIEKIIEKKHYLLFTSKNIREFDIIKKALNKFMIASCDYYLELEMEDKKRVASFLYANKKHAPNGILAKFIPNFIEHWKILNLAKDKAGLSEFNNIYNEDIKTKGSEAAIIVKMLKNLNGKDKYSKVKAYSYEDLSVLINKHILLTNSHIDNLQISSSVTSRKDEIVFVVSGDKDLVDDFDFDKYLYSLYNETKDLYPNTSWNSADEYRGVISKVLRELTLQTKLDKAEKKAEEKRVKKKV